MIHQLAPPLAPPPLAPMPPPPSPSPGEAYSSSTLPVGAYECHKYDGTNGKNDYHYVTIKAEGLQLRWSNRAGVSWMLTPRADGNLDVGKECPYYTNGHTVCQVVRNSTGSVTSLLGPWDEHYDAA